MITRYDPFRDALSLRRVMDQLFDLNGRSPSPGRLIPTRSKRTSRIEFSRFASPSVKRAARSGSASLAARVKDSRYLSGLDSNKGNRVP